MPRRRTVLAAVGSVGAVGLLGAVNAVGAIESRGDPVSILAAGSLQRTLGDGLREAVDAPIRVEAHGSVTAARLVAEGQRDPDIVVLADVALFEELLAAPWHATVATNELVVVHGDQPDPHPLVTAAEWFRPVLDGRASLGRTDPSLDPLGYRTIFALDLAASLYGEPDLREALLAHSAVYPETSLVSHFESGAVDAAIVYRNMATERDYPVIELPPSIDLGDPDRDYSAARYRLDDGTAVRGAPIRYGAWARSDDQRVREVFATLAEGTVLADNGLGAPRSLPTYHGAVPDHFRV
jgi:molybdate/tungstate transport system substrate-binding protein